MDLIIDPRGQASCIYGETINLAEIGQLNIQRASHVEPDAQGRWLADLSPVNGPTLGPFAQRSEALAAEVTWLREHWLGEHSPTKKRNRHDCSRRFDLMDGAVPMDRFSV